MGLIAVTWSTIYLTVQTTLCVVAVFTPIDVFRGNWGRAIVGLFFGLAAGGIALFVVRLNRKLRTTAEVNGWELETVERRRWAKGE